MEDVCVVGFGVSLHRHPLVFSRRRYPTSAPKLEALGVHIVQGVIREAMCLFLLPTIDSVAKFVGSTTMLVRVPAQSEDSEAGHPMYLEERASQKVAAGAEDTTRSGIQKFQKFAMDYSERRSHFGWRRRYYWNSCGALGGVWIKFWSD